MSEKRATLIITLKDLASGGMKSLSSGLDTLNSKWLGVSAAVAGTVAFLADCLRAYSEQENAVNKLNVALRNQGIYTAETSKDLQDFASELQKVTTFSDENIIQTEAMLTTFGLAGDELKKTTKAALDLSTGLGVDLTTATMLLGKAAVGETTTLGRYGIKIDENIPKADRFAAALDAVNARFGGSAEAAVNTMSGSLANLGNKLNDIQERIGEELVPVIRAWVGWLNKALDAVDKLAGGEANAAKGRELTIIGLEKQKKELMEHARLRGNILPNGLVILNELERDRLKIIDDAIIREKKQMEAETEKNTKSMAMANTRKAFLDAQAAEEAAKAEEKRAKELADLDLETANILQKHQTRLQQKNALLAFYTGSDTAIIQKNLATQQIAEATSLMKRLQENGKFAEAKLVQEQLLSQAEQEMQLSLTAFKKKNDENQAQNLQSTLAFIATLSTAHNRSLFYIGKAAALASAYINTALAVTMALRSAPPPFNFILAGAVGAAGAVQIATIAGAQLAEGGIVRARPGGIQATIGEGGSDEAVIPLDSPDAQARLGGVGGTHVHIHAGVVVADAMSVRAFAKRIDEELFRLNRRNEAVTFS